MRGCDLVIENTQKITFIKADKQISLYCPLGKDFYTANIFIEFLPNECYMDYIDFDKFIDHMSGESLTIEDAAQKVYDELQRYKPKASSVTIDAYSNTHMHVTVTKSDGE